jgi:hypothetical protein
MNKLDYTKTPEKVKDLYITPYKYKVNLDPMKGIIGGNHCIVFNNNPRLIPCGSFEFYSVDKLLKSEVEKMISGTENIVSIEGEFIDE